PYALTPIRARGDADVAAFENDLLLVRGGDRWDERPGRAIRNDMVVLGDRVQDRNLDTAEPPRMAADRHRVVEETIVPHQVLGRLAKIFARQRERVRRPA